MARFGSMLTNIGIAAFANAVVLGGKVDIAKFAVGDGAGSYYVPTPTMTALKKECWRGNIAKYEIDEVSPNVINVTAILPSTVGGFTVREIGLFTTDNKMLAIGNVPDTEKVIINEGAAAELMVTMQIAVSNTDVINVTVDPTVIIASKADIEKHNISPLSHQDIRQSIVSHTTDQTTHVTQSEKNSITKNLTHKKNGKINAFTGLNGATGKISCIASMTASYAVGDSFTVDGVVYTIATSNGEPLDDNAFIAGVDIPIIIDTVGKKINFKLGGGGFPPSWVDKRTAIANEVIAKDDAITMQITNDLRSGMNAVPIVGLPLNQGSSGNGTGIAFNPSNSWFSFGLTMSPFIMFFKPIGGQFVRVEATQVIDILPSACVRYIAYSHDGTYMTLVTQGVGALVYKYNGTSYNKLPNLSIMQTNTKKAFFSPNDDYMITMVDWGFFSYKRSGDTFTSMSVPAIMKNIQSLIFTPDSKYMVATYSNNQSEAPYLHEFIMNTTSCSQVWGIQSPQTTCADISITPDGEYIFVGGYPNYLFKRTNAINGSYSGIVNTDLQGVPYCNQFNTDGKYMFKTINDSPNNVSVYAFENGVFTKQTNPNVQTKSIPFTSCVSSDGKYFAASSASAEDMVVIYDLKSTTTVKKLNSLALYNTLFSNKYAFFGLGIAQQNANIGEQCKVNLFPPINNNLGGIY